MLGQCGQCDADTGHSVSTATSSLYAGATRSTDSSRKRSGERLRNPHRCAAKPLHADSQILTMPLDETVGVKKEKVAQVNNAGPTAGGRATPKTSVAVPVGS